MRATPGWPPPRFPARFAARPASCSRAIGCGRRWKIEMKIPVVALDLALLATAPASGAEHPRDPPNSAKFVSRLSVMTNTCSKYFTANVEIGREFQQRAIEKGRSL